MSNGNGKERRLDSGVCFANTFNNVRPEGSKAPLFAEGKIYLSPASAALAALGDPIYVSVFGLPEMRTWVEEAEAEVGKMRGGVSFSISTSPYVRDEESDEVRFKRIITELGGKPTASDAEEARLQAAYAGGKVLFPDWLAKRLLEQGKARVSS